MSDSVRAGVIGFGLAGRIFHASVVDHTPGVELAAIVERSGDAARAAFPHARTVRSVDELLADATIQLCIVATPNESHVPLARRCLEAGRHVVIDKPFALSSADAAALGRLARERGLVLSAFHNRRWDGDFLTVQALIASGQMGRVVSFTSRFDRFRPLPRLEAWRESGGPGGGVLWDLGPHLLDQALVLFGAPRTIWASVRTERPGARADDAFDLVLSYGSAGDSDILTVKLHASMSAVTRWARFVVEGTGVEAPEASGSEPDNAPVPQGAGFLKFGLDPQEAALKAGDTFATPGFGHDPEETWGTLTTAEAGATPKRIPTEPGDYRRYYAGVRDAIVKGTPPPVTAEDARQVLRLIELARASSESGCAMPVNFEGA